MSSRKNKSENGPAATTPSGMGGAGSGEKGASPSHSGGRTGAAKGRPRRLPVGVAKTTIGLAFLLNLSKSNDDFAYALAGTLDPEEVAS